jgi:hypothetical protein
MPDVHEPRPEALADITEDERVELDVRPVLRDAGEPFSLIMGTVREVPEGHVLRLRATFKPVPLFGVMRARGWRHWIEYGEGDDWVVWFYRTKDVR